MEKFKWSDDSINDLINAVFEGTIDPENLPADFYYAVSDYFHKALTDGFGGALSDFEMGSPDYLLLQELTDNIYIFSAARTFQQTLEMSDALVDKEGNLRSLADFKKEAQDIYNRYNGGEDEEGKPLNGYINTEYNTAVTQAGNAKKWRDVESKKEILPYLRWVAVGDEVECDICGELDGICLPVEDSFWDENAPAAHFNCRCVVEQLDIETGKDEETDEDEVDERVERAGVPDEFKFNPGKNREIFSTEGVSKHPYFEVPKEYRTFAESNFNLPI